MASDAYSFLGIDPPTKPGSKLSFKPASSKQSAGDFLGVRATKTPEGKRRIQTGAVLPFLQRSILSTIDKPEDKKAYLENMYGKEAVEAGKKGELYVNVGGKRIQAYEGFLPSLVGQAPETVLGIAGAVGASPGGPIASVAGAAAGSMAGRSIKEATKAATGVERKTPGELVTSVTEAGVAGAVGEGATRLLKAVPSRLTRGPLPEWLAGQTPESRAMTERTVAGGAVPPAQSTLPTAMKLQRVKIIADKIVGPSRSIDRRNIGYLQEKASGILDKAGVKGAAKDETMSRLISDMKQPAMSFQDVGREIQKNTQYMLRGSTRGMPRRTLAYLRQLNAAGKTPEDAYAWLTAPGQTDRLDRFVAVMGKNSVVVQAVQQRALRQLLAGALDRSERGEAIGALGKELSQFTRKQQDLLFPGGLAADVRTLAQEVEFIFPKIIDPAMGGFTAGSIMQHPLVRFASLGTSRIIQQGYYGMMRGILQNPAIIRRLAIGFKGDSVQRIAARNALREMFYFGFLEMQQPGQDPQAQKQGAK